MTILKKFSLLLLVPIFFACSDDDVVLDSDIVGTWNLIEQYLDPGDGSGEYEPVDSDRTITFNEDGSFSANGNMCGISIDTAESASGSYSEENGTIDVDDCAFTGFGITYEINNGYLIINFPCIEGCGQKYEKVN